MKANFRNRVDEKTKLRIEQAVEEEFETRKSEYEKKFNDKFAFLYMLATAIYAHDTLGFGPKRRHDIVTGIVQKANEISEYLSSNKVIDANDREEHYDVEYNLEYLKRLSEEYGVPFEEEVFYEEF